MRRAWGPRAIIFTLFSRPGRCRILQFLGRQIDYTKDRRKAIKTAKLKKTWAQQNLATIFNDKVAAPPDHQQLYLITGEAIILEASDEYE